MTNIITARFNGTCASCHRDIQVGERIRWEKGQPASHVNCHDSYLRETASRRPFGHLSRMGPTVKIV